ncbi:MAG: class I SAM-dependent methyltransferase [Candidatus Eisenbacteria bacterium]|nr:class I SAM-dependent methyltransferase [Candidatus Eisenbacteria bacterium]
MPGPRLDPEEWNRIHDGPADARSQLFRRGLALARDACLEHSRPGEIWADVGCATGHLAIELLRSGRRVVGLDIDLRLLRATRIRAAQGLPLAVADALRLPLRSRSLDGILAVSLLGYLEEPGEFFREAFLALRPGGHLLATCTNRSGMLRRASRPLGPISAGTADGAAGIQLHSAACLERSLQGTGFVLLPHRFYNFYALWGGWAFPPAGLSGALEALCPAPLGRGLARNILFRARKP